MRAPRLVQFMDFTASTIEVIIAATSAADDVFAALAELKIPIAVELGVEVKKLGDKDSTSDIG